MIGAGTFLNPALKIVTVVAVLAASYFFIVRPILDTTESTIDRAFDESAKISKSVNKSVRRAQQEAQQQGAQSVTFESQGLTQKQADRLLRCVQNAAGDVNKIQVCNEKYAQ